MTRGKGGHLYDDDDLDYEDYDGDQASDDEEVVQVPSRSAGNAAKGAKAGQASHGHKAGPSSAGASSSRQAGAAAAPHRPAAVAAKKDPAPAAAQQASYPLVPPALAAAREAAAKQAAAAGKPADGGEGGASATLQAPFKFDTPSPDDVVLAAQAGRPIGAIQPPVAAPSSGKRQVPGVPGLPQSKFLSQPTPLQQQQQKQQQEQAAAAATAAAASSSGSASAAAAGEAAVSSALGGLSLGSGASGTGSAPGPASAVSQRRRIAEYEMERDLARECSEHAAAEAQQQQQGASTSGSGAAEAGPRPGLHLVVLGHVDAGKSTLMGRLLHDVGVISAKDVHRNQRESAQAGKASFGWAWALDERPEERARGVTVDVAMQRFRTARYNVTLLDAPGHRDFVPNAIAGAAQADAALLLVDGSPGGFEAGFEGGGGELSGGQTREHAQLARSLGIEQVAVVVSKLDTCGFSQERFLQIQASLLPFLKTCGFKESCVQWLPAVGPSGQNLIGPPTEPGLSAWWSGPTVLGAIDAFSSRDRAIAKPLRLPVSDVSRTKAGAMALGGKMEAGALRVGSRVMLVPGGEQGTVKGIEVDGQTAKLARAGDSVEVSLSGIDVSAVPHHGAVLCHPDFAAPLATRFEARVVVLDAPTPILRGQQVTLHAHTAREEGHISALVAALNPKTGESTKAKPRCLTKGQTALVEVTAARSLVLEEYADYKALGRIALREGGRTVAVGVVTRILA